MLLLFNTGYRVGYIDNVLRTLFLPHGADNEYRYRVGDDGQVSQSEIAHIRAQKGLPALVCFGDRYGTVDGAPSYVFYPLRMGEVVDVTESGGRIFVKVRLGDYVSASAPAHFTAQLYAVAAQESFQLLKYDTHPENERDGRYAFTVSDEVLLESLDRGDKAWLPTVKQLETLTTFKSKLPGDPIFSRATVESRKQAIHYETVKKAQMASLEKDDDVRLVVHYYFPSQSANTAARAVMKVSCPNGAQILAPGVHELGMQESRVEIPVVFEPSSDKRYFSFDISFDQVSGGPAVVGASEGLLLRATDAYWRELLLAFAVLIYVLGSVVLVKENPLGGALLQGLALIGMLKLVGKKVV